MVPLSVTAPSLERFVRFENEPSRSVVWLKFRARLFVLPATPFARLSVVPARLASPFRVAVPF